MKASSPKLGWIIAQPNDSDIRADNDKTVARLYGISAAKFTHLLRSFKGMATKRPEYLAWLAQK